MEWGQSLRAICLRPMLVALTGARITPDALTVLSGLSGIAFMPLWLWGANWWAVAALSAHVLLDGIDGPLARHQATASPRGSFTDTFTDQIVVSVVTTAWMIGHPTATSIAAGTAFVFLYALVVAIAMVRNALRIPYSWLVRPRFFVFATMLLETCGITSLTMPTLIVCTALLALKTATGFFQLRNRIPGPESI
jgi:phosphatidylglycerophosphate synthase